MISNNFVDTFVPSESDRTPHSANQSSFHVHESRPNNDDMILRGLVHCSYLCLQSLNFVSVYAFFTAADCLYKSRNSGSVLAQP
mmetsp:Transcript_26004/g.38189  ORF Transcript_26004/g.38189 Transcript_26004/m.38189 type:complete len:84 (+) Transcript_26004:1875-2126(+)